MMKTKWKPLLLYRPVCENKLALVYVRYDTKTGLLDFKTQRIIKDIGLTNFAWELDANKILQDIMKDGNNE